MSSFESASNRDKSHGNKWGTCYRELEHDSESWIDLISEKFVDELKSVPGTLKREVLSKFCHGVRIMYNNNPYHNWRHACHVTVSAKTLLNGLCHPEAFQGLERIALLFSCIIHDVDHLGVWNSVLVGQGHEYAVAFNDQSPLEMRSLQVGFDILRRHNFTAGFPELSDIKERQRFRKLVVDLVLCTDIGDKDRSRLTTLKIQDAFDDAEPGVIEQKLNTAEGRVAALMLLLKASDICAAMQCHATGIAWARMFFMENPVRDSSGLAGFISSQRGYLEGYCLKVAKMLRDSRLVDASIGHEAVQNVENMLKFWDAEAPRVCAVWLKECRDGQR